MPNNNENLLTPGAGMVNVEGEVDESTTDPAESTSVDASKTVESSDSVKALESKIEALAATLESLAGKLTAPVKNSTEDSTDPAETATGSESTSVESGAELSDALKRVSTLEAELSRARFRDAIRNNAESAEVNVSAALDSDIVRESLKEVDLADSDAVTAALKEVGEKHSYLKNVTKTRVPRSNGVTPGTKAAGSLSRTEFDALSYKDKLAWKQANPDAFSALMSH